MPMWTMDARLMKGDSPESLSLSQLLEEANIGSALLAESLSINSLWSVSSDLVVPSFPRGRKPVLYLLVDLHAGVPLFSQKKRHDNYYEEDGKDIKITVSMPTKGRLAKILDEPICVANWAVRVPARTGEGGR